MGVVIIFADCQGVTDCMVSLTGCGISLVTAGVSGSAWVSAFGALPKPTVIRGIPAVTASSICSSFPPRTPTGTRLLFNKICLIRLKSNVPRPANNSKSMTTGEPMKKFGAFCTAAGICWFSRSKS